MFKLNDSAGKEELKEKLEDILKELETMEKEIMRLKLERKKRGKKTKTNLNVNNMNNQNAANVSKTGNKNCSLLSVKKINVKEKMGRAGNSDHVNIKQENNVVLNEFNMMENLVSEENIFKGVEETERDKNKSQEGKYLNQNFDKEAIEQGSNTINHLESININVKILKFFSFDCF